MRGQTGSCHSKTSGIVTTLTCFVKATCYIYVLLATTKACWDSANLFWPIVVRNVAVTTMPIFRKPCEQKILALEKLSSGHTLARIDP